MEKDFLSDVTLDFLEEQDDMIDIRNDEQFRYSQMQKRIDRLVDQNRRISSIVKNADLSFR
ncbi:MAG: hypothetical protein IKN85_02220 [Oscillospiraceae bacterium]|nr:hypothetical protein [Oscillospiraceae bacterium]MBR3024244.1 hypothetical protein [Oscillospiraceae bacterium]MBR3534623.1 hypothetical protein [Oscillospiraceae bacterium]MBR4622196.1 hypothetical protein [Ruminococcus sp.]